LFFTIYAKFEGVWLAPAWLEGREVIAVFADRADPKPSYIMWLEWRDGRISFIRDYRYARYVVADAELSLALDAKPADGGAAEWTIAVAVSIALADRCELHSAPEFTTAGRSQRLYRAEAGAARKC